MSEEGYFFDIEEVHFGAYPTVLDFLVISLTEYLLEVEASAIREDAVRPAASELIVDEFSRPVSFDDAPALLAPAVMEAVGTIQKSRRREANERWKVRRLILPTDYGLYEWGEEEQREELREKAKQILLGWFKSFRTKGGKAQAGYQAAVLHDRAEEYVEAVEMCRKVEDRYGSTYASYQAKVLRSGIQEPALYLEATHVLPPGRDALEVTARNLETIHFRAYHVEPDTLRAEVETHSYGFYGWSGLLGSPHTEWIEKTVLKKKKPSVKWSVETGDKGDYKPIDLKIESPDLKRGIYLVLASGDDSFKVGDVQVSACFLNVSEIVIVGTPGVTDATREAYFENLDAGGSRTLKDDVFRFYTLDARTGEAVAGVDIDVWASNNYTNLEVDLESGADGISPMVLDVNVEPPPPGAGGYYEYRQYQNNFGADPIAHKDGSHAYWGSGENLSYLPANPLIVFLETDRPIYRPGHEVRAKAVVTRITPAGYRTLGKNQSVTFEVKDPNGEAFHTETVSLSEFGSAETRFEIPKGRLLGGYTIETKASEGRFQRVQSAYFQVEEYKQPEFEITLEEAKKPWKYGQEVKLEGEVTYYFGGPVADAHLSYVIRRSMYVPWYYRYWFGSDLDTGQEELVSGKMRTDEDGRFSIDFTPEAPPRLPYQSKVPDMAQFTLEVEARDSGGRTIAGSQTYKAGKQALYFAIKPEADFFRSGEDVRIRSELLTINDAPAPGKSTYKIFRLEDEPAKDLEEVGYTSYGGQWSWVPPLDVQLKDVASGKSVGSGSVEHGEDGAAMVTLSPGESGAYRIVMTTRDEWGEKVEQEKIFVVAGEPGSAVPLRVASVTLVEKQEYEVGDTARFVLGSDLSAGNTHVELWAGTYFLGTEKLSGKGKVSVLEVPVSQKMKGGFTLRWFGVKDMQVFQGQQPVAVPWSEKKLAVSLDPFKEKLAPGEEATWGVRIADHTGKPVKGEALALMYDRALEYYITSSNPWMDVLYLQAPEPMLGTDSVFTPYVAAFPVSETILSKLIAALKQPPEPPKPPGLRTWDTWAGGRPGGLFRSRNVMLAQEAKYAEGEETTVPATPAPAMAEMDDEAPMKAKAKPDASRGAGKQQAPKIETRKAFADTAFFHPFVRTGPDGTASFSFKAPEQLTSWTIKVLSFTTDVKQGSLSSEAVTKKDLMVRADIPRFFREKDRGTVTAVVHNESEKPLSGDLFIEITEDGESVHQRVKLGEDRKSFSIEPHALASFDWMLEIPEGTTTYKVRVAASAGELVDAEERELPILPSRQRLIESAFIALNDTETKKLEIKLEDDPTRISESMTLQVDPQLALDLLNTIPFLVEYPYECVEQTLNRYVPLAIVNEIYKDYPAIRKAMGKVPKRDTITPPWYDDDPRRLITLMETPWVRQAKGYKPSYPLTDLLDPAIVDSQRQISLDKLRSVQLPNGAFPWFPGGRADLYMTLYVLAGMAEARRYDVEVPHDLCNNALAYVNSEIPSRLKKEPSHLAIVAYASYVLTSYPTDEFSEAARGHKLAKKWIKFLEKHIHALTPFGKAYLAYVHHRLGNKKRASEILDMIMDSAKEDPIAGVYWAPEKYSWVWYSDSVEKHAFILRTLQELRPKDSRIPGMVQWLVFNRKGNVWKSTKASSAAVFSLLDYLNRIGALGSKQTYKIDWGFVQESIVVLPDDFLEEPLRWHVTEPDLTPSMSSATISKAGPGPAFASMTWIYSTDQLPEASTPGLLSLKRTFYRRVKEEDKYHLKPIKSGETVYVGDEVAIHLKITSRSQFEYMHLKDPKAAGFEAETLLSGWKWDPLSTYEEPRDSLTNFFLSWIPHGEYILKYTLRPTKPGTYRVGASQLQSMYAPEMTAHSAGHILKVEKQD